jgi:hypothetical protein
LNTKYKEDQFVNIIKSHESNEPNINSTIKTAADFVEKLYKSDENSDTEMEGMRHTKARLGEFLKIIKCGQCIRSIDRQLIGEDDTFLWLSRGQLKAEPEREIAAQDQPLQTKYHATSLHEET